jgi:hypothetical protein
MSSGTRGTSSSAPASPPKQLREIIELGEALVAELGLDQSNDVLGRWMAHHLAKLIEAAKSAADDARVAAEDRCVTAILEVWRHRNCLPHGARPFEPAERVLDVITALDPDATQPFYNRLALDWDDQSKPAERKVLDVVVLSDRVARQVLRHLLSRAIEEIPDQTRAWVKRASGMGLAGRDIATLRQIVYVTGDAEKDEHRRLVDEVNGVRSQIERLERFANMAKLVQDELETRLASLEAELPDEDAEN